MLTLTAPIANPLLASMIRADRSAPIRKAAHIVDHLTALHHREARRQSLYWRMDKNATPAPARWFRREPRASDQYAGHMATTAARDVSRCTVFEGAARSL